METMNAVSVINLMPSTKVEIQSFVKTIEYEMSNGIMCPLVFWRNLKTAEKAIDEISKSEKIKDVLLSEAEKYGKSFEKNSAKYEICEAGTKYDYSTSNDSELNELQLNAADISEKIKARQKYLQSLPENGAVNPETGEVNYRPAKSSKTIVKLTLK